QMLAVASSATLPSASSMAALSKPRACASRSARPGLGYRHAALASVGAISYVGRLNGDRVREKPVGAGIGDTWTEMQNLVVSGSAATKPPSAQYIGRMYSSASLANRATP